MRIRGRATYVRLEDDQLERIAELIATKLRVPASTPTPAPRTRRVLPKASAEDIERVRRIMKRKGLT